MHAIHAIIDVGRLLNSGDFVRRSDATKSKQPDEKNKTRQIATDRKHSCPGNTFARTILKMHPRLYLILFVSIFFLFSFLLFISCSILIIRLAVGELTKFTSRTNFHVQLILHGTYRCMMQRHSWRMFAEDTDKAIPI